MSRAFGSCAAVMPHLHAFADGELRGETLRGVSQHVDHCESCSDRVVEIGDLGDLLRQTAVVDADPADLAGLADGVVSRIRAEDHESWRGMLERATDDLHWVMVGVGSVAASFVSAVIVSVVIQSGIGQRADSVAALLNTLAMEAPPTLGYQIIPDSFGDAAANGVQLASLVEVNDDGHQLSLQLLGGIDKKDAAILAEMRRMRFQHQLEQRRITDPDGRQFIWLVSKTEVRGL